MNANSTPEEPDGDLAEPSGSLGGLNGHVKGHPCPYSVRRPARLFALDSIQAHPTARSVGKQEQRRAQVLGVLPPCTRSLSQQAGRVLTGLPRGGRCQFITWSLSLSARGGIVVNSRRSPRRRWSRKPRPTRMPRACLVKPVAARRDFLGITWDFPTGASVFNLQPPTGPVEPRRAQG
jgi:hypothetical protein